MGIISLLQDFGLTENEAKVYLANLELGEASVQALGHKSGVKRTTVYTTLEGLKEKGLLSQTKKGKKTLYLAESPETLKTLAERRAQALKTALPELKSIFNLPTLKPKVRFYEGREGYVSVYENIIHDNPPELLCIASYDDFYRHLDQQYEDAWTQRRVKNKINLRWMAFKTKETQKYQKEGRKALREVRFLPQEFSFTSTMFIYGDKVVIVSGGIKEFTAVVIENSEFYQMFKQLFEMLWIAHRDTSNETPR